MRGEGYDSICHDGPDRSRSVNTVHANVEGGEGRQMELCSGPSPLLSSKQGTAPSQDHKIAVSSCLGSHGLLIDPISYGTHSHRLTVLALRRTVQSSQRKWSLLASLAIQRTLQRHRGPVSLLSHLFNTQLGTYKSSNSGQLHRIMRYLINGITQTIADHLYQQ